MRMCPHCRALIADDNLEICPKCKSNLNSYYDLNGFIHYKTDKKNKISIEQPKNNISADDNNTYNCKETKNRKNALKKLLTEKKSKYIFVMIAVYFVVIIGAVLFFTMKSDGNYVTNTSDDLSAQNYATYVDGVNIALPEDDVDKKIKSIQYNQVTDEYILTYKKLPDFFSNLSVGDIFVVEADDTSKQDCFKLGFSGKITDITNDSKNSVVKFSVPDFTELFSSLSISTLDSSTVSDVSFYPSQDYDIEQLIVPMAVTQSSEKFSLGNFNAGYTFKEADKESSIDGYDILAKQIKLKIGHKSETFDDNKIDISGEITLDYPAVKFVFDYDNSNGENEVKNYDVGFITKEKAKIKLDAKGEIGADVPDDIIDKINVLDVTDTTDEETGKIILGTYVVGYNVPTLLLHNNKNNVSYLSLGISIQLAVTLGGEIEIEYSVEQSGYLEMKNSSNEDLDCCIKNYNYPNPVINETGYNENESYDELEIKTTGKGTMDLNLAVGIDVGFCILGTIPLKLVNDFACINFVRSVTSEKEDSLVTFNEDGKWKMLEDVTFYQLKSQSKILLSLGAKFKVGPLKYDVGKVAVEKQLYTYVWDQYPEPTDFVYEHCDFGGIQIGETISKDKINEIFYDNLDLSGGKYLEGKLKDSFLQSTTDSFNDKINMEAEDIYELFGVSPDDYDIVCFSQGAVYLMKDGQVKAQIISGKGIYNESDISCGMSKNLVRQIYSEPDDSYSVEIRIGKLGEEILKALNGDELLKYNGTDISCFVYNSKDSNNELILFFDGSDKLLFAICE